MVRRKRGKLGSVVAKGGSKRKTKGAMAGGMQQAAEINAKDMGTSSGPERVFAVPMNVKKGNG